MTEEFIKEFIDQCIYRMQESIQKITQCLHELEESEVWKRPNKNSNSVGNLILHLCGNMRQYAISSLGNTKDERERNKEFSAEDGYSKSELLEKLKATADEVRNTIQNISPGELFRKRKVQGFSQSGIAIIVHVTEHLSYHTGQIIFWTKLLKDKDLGFYSGVNLEAKNEI
ncbi:MAG TPA: DinB family protein [Chitinophagaceae bacterium]|nr:DinB family protein [Chitinophagaceae bacterium]